MKIASYIFIHNGPLHTSDDDDDNDDDVARRLRLLHYCSCMLLCFVVATLAFLLLSLLC